MRRRSLLVFTLMGLAGCGRTPLNAARGDAADGRLEGSAGGTGDLGTDAGGDGGLLGGMGGTGGADTATSSDPSCTPGLFTLGGLPVSQLSENPTFIAIGDLDADGKADLVATLWDANKVAVALGRGNGRFSRTVEIDAASQPRAAAIGDLNGDGKNDLVVAGASSVSVLLSEGGGRFSPRVDYPVDRDPDHVVLADVNGDGRRDLAMTNADANFISVLLNRGDGTFAAAQKHQVGDAAYSLAAGDLNGDGRDDLAVAVGGTSPLVALLFAARDGTFSEQTIEGFANVVVIDELNGDGKPDLALSTGRAVRVLLNQGGGSFSAPVDYPAGPVSACFAYGLTSGDTDLDGRADLALLNDDCENITVLRNRGDGTFADAEIAWVGTYPILLALGDLTGDRRDDLAFVGDARQVLVLPAQPDGGLISDWVPVTPTLTYPSVLGDVNGDGRLDFAVAQGDERMVEVRIGQADGTFAAGSRYPINGQPNSLAMADVSGDGRRDLVTWDYSGMMSVMLGQEDGKFGSPRETKITRGPSSCVFGDLDHDGDADVLTSGGSEMVGVWLSQGDGTLTPTTGYALPSWPTAMVVGDFNGDGKLDLGYASRDARDVGIALGQGDGTFATGTRHTATGTPIGLAAGDVNGDTIMDLIVTSHSPNTVRVFLGGDGLRGPWRETPVDFYADEVMGIGDVNLDGRTDLAVMQGGSVLFIMLGRGDGTFAESPANGLLYGGPKVLADLTGDGRLDLGVLEEVDGVLQWNVYRNSLCR